MARPPETEEDRDPRDLGEITLDRLFGTPSPINLEPVAPAERRRPLSFWTRAYLWMLGVRGAAGDSPVRSWRDHLVDSLIIAALVVLLAWIGYLTFRAFGFLMHR
jgi:hypothetical protein